MYYRITYIIWEKWGIYHIYTILIGLKEQPSLQSMHVHNSRTVQIGFKKLESINKSEIEIKRKALVYTSKSREILYNNDCKQRYQRQKSIQ